ncbi:MAG TPA: hypothetical protein DDX07_01635 [Porphyromonadaceae bacterium]|nr:hypothetical protein [Porphyromonadaceae bacterium]
METIRTGRRTKGARNRINTENRYKSLLNKENYTIYATLCTSAKEISPTFTAHLSSRDQTKNKKTQNEVFSKMGISGNIICCISAGICFQL